jgi:hypothetical protein
MLIAEQPQSIPDHPSGWTISLCRRALPLSPTAPPGPATRQRRAVRNPKDFKADKKNQKVKHRIGWPYFFGLPGDDMTSSWLRASSDFETPCSTATLSGPPRPTWRSPAGGKCPGAAEFREGDEIVRHKGIRRNHNCGCDDDEATWFALGARQFVSRVSGWAF